MSVRFYSWEDAGAPELPNVPSQRFIDNLKLIFKACLIDGYGEKPAAGGWEIVHEHTDGFSIGNGNAVANFVHDASGSAKVLVLDSVTDGTGAEAGGPNKRSGSWFEGGGTSAHRHWVHSGNFWSSTPLKKWSLVGDDRTFVIYGTSTSDNVDRSNSQGFAFYVGDVHPFELDPIFCVLGGLHAANGYSASDFFVANTVAGTLNRNPRNGTYNQGLDAGYRPGVMTLAPLSSATTQTAIWAPGRLNFVRCPLIGRGVELSGANTTVADAPVGVTRGLLTCPELSPAKASNIFPLLGISAPTASDYHRPITLPGGDRVLLIHTGTSVAGFVSLEDMDWM